MAKTDLNKTQAQESATTLLAGEFASQEELVAAYEALKAAQLTVQDDYETAKAKAVEAAIKQFKQAEQPKLGTPNVIPGARREPVSTIMADGTMRVDY